MNRLLNVKKLTPQCCAVCTHCLNQFVNRRAIHPFKDNSATLKPFDMTGVTGYGQAQGVRATGIFKFKRDVLQGKAWLKQLEHMVITQSIDVGGSANGQPGQTARHVMWLPVWRLRINGLRAAHYKSGYIKRLSRYDKRAPALAVVSRSTASISPANSYALLNTSLSLEMAVCMFRLKRKARTEATPR